MARVKTDFNPSKLQLKKFKQAAKAALPDIYKEEIINEIEGGRSPVAKQGRFQRYSESYRTAIKKGYYSGKRQSPVNLKLTGKLLKSLSVKSVGNRLRIIFDNFLADIHNRQGAGKSKVVRRMLPTNKGESFNRNITQAVQVALDKIARKIFR